MTYFPVSSPLDVSTVTCRTFSAGHKRSAGLLGKSAVGFVLTAVVSRALAVTKGQ